MRKSIIFIILTLIAVLCVFTSCGDKECQHQWTSQETPASCLENGKRVNTCTVCGMVQESITGVATGHTWVPTVITQSTCSTPGEQADKCSNCGLVNEATKNTIPKTSHIYDIVVETVNPECDKEGYILKKCTGCEETKKEIKKELGHKWESKQETLIQVDCVTDGSIIKYQECSVCNASTKEQATPEKVEHWGHDLIYNEKDPNFSKKDYLKEIIPANCLENQKKIYQCVNDGCKETHTVEVRNTALGHKYQPGIEINVAPATCTTAKTYTYQCENDGCKETKQVTEGKALGHDHTEIMTDETIPATCLDDEIITKKCKRCEDRITEKGEDALGHDHTVFVKNITPISCDVDGVDEFKCERCDDKTTKINENSRWNHKHYEDGIYENTHSQNGVAYTKGSDANVKAEPVPVKCNADGYTPQYCYLCGAEDVFENVDIVPKSTKPHTRNPADTSDTVEYVNPTCITKGYWNFICTVCGETDYEWDESEEGKPTGKHGNYTKPGKVHAPTCTEEGWTEYVCTLDDNCTAINTDDSDAEINKKQDIVPVIDHTFTGLAEGVISCDVCKKEFFDINYVQQYVDDPDGNDVNNKEVNFGNGSLKVTVTLGNVNAEPLKLLDSNTSVKKEFTNDDENISVIRIVSESTDTKFIVKVNGEQVGEELTGQNYYYIDIIEVDTVESIEVVATKATGENAGDINATVDIFDATANIVTP